jgi:pyruvate/2-oxoglutarate dehydrogenase complex dihydrolipoamide acyltransferase (E2) component
MNRAGLICPLMSGPHRTYRLDADDGKGHFGQIACQVGDAIKPGDILAKIETDKAMMEYESIDEGTIASLAMPEGSQDVPVGTVIATVAAASEAVGEPVLETVNAAPPQPRWLFRHLRLCHWPIPCPRLQLPHPTMERSMPPLSQRE